MTTATFKQPATQNANSVADELSQIQERIRRNLRKGLDAAVDIGRDLRRVRDDKLYQAAGAKHGSRSFELYVERNFAMTRGRAYQFIDVANVHDALSTTVDNCGGKSALPANEAVCRELAILDGAEQVRSVWREATRRTRTPTAAVVRAIVRQARPRPAPTTWHRRLLHLDDFVPDAREALVKLAFADQAGFKALFRESRDAILREALTELDNNRPGPG